MLAVLKMLPIANKTILKDSKIWNVVEKWSTQTIETPAPTTTTPAAMPAKESTSETENKTSEATAPASNGDASGKPSGRCQLILTTDVDIIQQKHLMQIKPFELFALENVH